MSRKAVASAHERLQHAEQGVRDAISDRDAAQHELDQALATIGWRRLAVVFAEDQRFYENRLHPGVTLPLHDVLQAITEQEALNR